MTYTGPAERSHLTELVRVWHVTSVGQVGQTERQANHVHSAIAKARRAGLTHLLHIDDDEMVYVPCGLHRLRCELGHATAGGAHNVHALTLEALAPLVSAASSPAPPPTAPNSSGGAGDSSGFVGNSSCSAGGGGAGDSCRTGSIGSASSSGEGGDNDSSHGTASGVNDASATAVDGEAEEGELCPFSCRAFKHVRSSYGAYGGNAVSAGKSFGSLACAGLTFASPHHYSLASRPRRTSAHYGYLKGTVSSRLAKAP